jgi:hypothetical protein
MALKNAHSNGYLEASDNRTGEIRVRWNKVDNFTSFRVERLAPNPAGGYTHEWDKVFGAGETDQYEDLAVTPGIIYEYRYFGLDGQNSTLLGHDTGAELPAGP